MPALFFLSTLENSASLYNKKAHQVFLYHHYRMIATIIFDI